MAKDFIGRYIWIVDTLRRYNRITRTQLDELWRKSPYSNGEGLPRRTFFLYRRAIEENFNITIACDCMGRYYIENDESTASSAYTNWLLDSYAINSALKESGAPQGRVSVEDVPSAREFLPPSLDAITKSQKINFTYAGFNRSRAEKNIIFHPYFLKRYKQRWYMVGYREKSKDIRTYALDRVREMTILTEHFSLPEGATPDDIFGDIIGVTSSKGEVKTVTLRTSTTQAKYLRALPLHDSQCEEVHDDYSIFNYRLKINWELVHEILGFGAEVEVLAPEELRLMVKLELQKALNAYEL